MKWRKHNNTNNNTGNLGRLLIDLKRKEFLEGIHWVKAIASYQYLSTLKSSNVHCKRDRMNMDGD